MRQLLQDIRTGDIAVVEVPAPAPASGAVLVRTVASVISAGTERAVMELGQKSLAGKARARPDLARKVVASVREDGLKPAVDKVRGRLEEPNPLGYSSCGYVITAPADADVSPGDLVACAGAGYAVHAEVVCVPRNLCARVPQGVAPEAAAYGTVATIALHGLRLCETALGDAVAVVGLGLIGQLVLELVAASGGIGVGFDPSIDRVELARAAGLPAEHDAAAFAAQIGRLTDGRGADAAVVAAASPNPEPFHSAITVCRERAVVSLVGDVPIAAPRAALFAKELRVVVSRSYGPGRYDPAYEEGGADYPAGYVRWTEGRNLGEVLRLMAARALRPERLTTHRFELGDGPEAYALLQAPEPTLGMVLTYPERGEVARIVTVPVGLVQRSRRRIGPRDRPRVAVVGAGTFARTVLLPALGSLVELTTVVTATGASARSTAERFGAPLATTDLDAALDDPSVDAVLIATRHDTHADYVVRSLQAGKHVFVEKPLALDRPELERVEAAARHPDAATLSVGFNRRWAPLAVQLRQALGDRGPVMGQIRINAGRIPRSHWTHDPAVGGGRIVGEMCHFIDLAGFLAGEPAARVTSARVRGSSEPSEDVVTATLEYPSGSVFSIVYSALGDPGLAKERVELLAEGGAGVLDDFRELTLHTGGRPAVHRSRRDKGHAAELRGWVEGCRTGVAPVALDEVLASMRTTFNVRDAGVRPS